MNAEQTNERTDERMHACMMRLQLRQTRFMTALCARILCNVECRYSTSTLLCVCRATRKVRQDAVWCSALLCCAHAVDMLRLCCAFNVAIMLRLCYAMACMLAVVEWRCNGCAMDMRSYVMNARRSGILGHPTAWSLVSHKQTGSSMHE